MPGIAELLAVEGYEVHLVTPDPVVSRRSRTAPSKGAMLRQHLHDVGIVFHVGVTITSWTPGLAAGRTQFGDAASTSTSTTSSW